MFLYFASLSQKSQKINNFFHFDSNKKIWSKTSAILTLGLILDFNSLLPQRW
jgi:hypothetical protein